MKKNFGMVVQRPSPLYTCPGYKVWKQYEGQPYIVFIDESFFEFFQLNSRTGYFCHAATAVPEIEYDSLKAELKPVFEKYKALTSPSEIEFKYSEFRRLEYSQRHHLALQIKNVLVKHGVAIGGFYTPLRAFVLEKVRFNLMDDATEIPADFNDLYISAVDELRGMFHGPGQSGILKNLLTLPFQAFSFFITSLNSAFRVVYDPRHSSEDMAVRDELHQQIRLTEVLKDLIAEGVPPNYYLGFDATKTSEQEIGLQIADFFAGEIRSFLQNNQEFMSFNATPKLITPTSHEPVNTVMEIDGHLFKTGALHKMPPSLRNRFFRPDPNQQTVLHLFRELFAAGILTCYSSWGQPRDLMIYEGTIWDQCE